MFSTAVPRPWEPSVLREAFLYHRDPHLKGIFARQRIALELRFDEIGNDTVSEFFSVLQRAGMVHGPLGLDFSPLQIFQRAYAPEYDILTDPAVRRVLELLVYPVDADLEVNHVGGRKNRSSSATSVLARTIWMYDQPARYGAFKQSQAQQSTTIALSQAAAPIITEQPTMAQPPLTRSAENPSLVLQRLERDGFVRLADWRDWGLDLDALEAQVRIAMPSRRVRPPPSAAATLRKMAFGETSRAPLPALMPLLNNAKLARVLRAYLNNGGPVRYDGHVIIHLSNMASEANYVSSRWHHDRCGRRSAWHH